MKVGIITICDYRNYGNRLQNYASQEVLKSLGCEVETIINSQNTSRKKKSTKSLNWSKLRKLKNMSAEDILRRLTGNVKYVVNKKNNAKYFSEKKKAFKKFSEDKIMETEFTITRDNIPTYLKDSYDFFVVGSDQVWNPTFRNGSSIDFLTFAPKHKRIVYAPSFGVSSIPDKFIANYRLWLSQMDYLSVREEVGANIIKELTGRDAVVLVDPTLMLSKEEWLYISKPAVNKPKNDYLLTYFLGSLSKERVKGIKQIASVNKLKIINLASMKDRTRYAIDPSEFIDYINSSSIILTDSFHGCVFSILFEKPFVVFERDEKIPSMNSRIDTLLSTFQLESRKWDNLKGTKNIFNIDYSHVISILEVERNRTIAYLKKALKIE